VKKEPKTVPEDLVCVKELTTLIISAQPAEFFSWGFVKDNVYVPLQLTILEELTSQITVPYARTGHNILQKVWQEAKYWCDIAQTICSVCNKLYFVTLS
jgi:hypothetical protein